MRRNDRAVDILLVIVLFYLFVVQSWAIWPFTIDDMYIPLRYAQHWFNGDGLVWNLKQPPVEGYSNFSFVLLGAGALFFHLDPVIVLKAAGVIGLFTVCVFVYLISRFWFSRRLAFIPVFYLLFYKGEIIWAVSGLETTVYQSLICAATYFAFRAVGDAHFPKQKIEANRCFYFLSGIFLSGAGMTRPEAPLWMVLLFFFLFANVLKKEQPNGWSDLGYWLLPIVLIYGSYFLWRWHYYGLLFPNPIYCKGWADEFVGILDNHYLKLIGPFLCFVLFACIRSFDLRYLVLILPSLLYSLLLYQADPVVAFENRLFLPAWALLLPLTFKGLSDLLLCFYKDNPMYEPILLVSALLFALLFIPGKTPETYRYYAKNPVAGEQLRGRVVQWLNANLRPTDVVVLGDSGMIPFYSPFTFIDSYCLNNRLMVQYPAKQRYNSFCKTILSEKPKAIILTSLIVKDKVVYTPADACLKPLLSKTSQYQLKEVFSTSDQESTYRYELFTNL